MNQLKIGYFADGPWSHLSLDKLLEDPTIQVQFICARFDAPDPVLRKKAEQHKIDYLVHPKVNSDEFFDQLIGYSSDLFVSMSFNQIFQKRIIEFPRMKTINCHAGKLPFYRGRNILNWALINDEKEFGITVHYIDEGIDTGDILAQQLFPISDQDSYKTVLERAYLGCAHLLYETIKKMQIGNITSVSQSDIHALGFYCIARRQGDEQLNWNQSSREIFNFVRAICYPGPEARTFCEGTEIKINRVKFLPDATVFKGIPGSVISVSADSFFVKTTDSFVEVIEWSGQKKIKIGSRFN